MKIKTKPNCLRKIIIVFTERMILLKKNERNRWKKSDKFENKRNTFFWTIEKKLTKWVVRYNDETNEIKKPIVPVSNQTWIRFKSTIEYTWAVKSTIELNRGKMSCFFSLNGYNLAWMGTIWLEWVQFGLNGYNLV